MIRLRLRAHLLAALLIAAPTRAEERNPVLAQALFDEAKRLVGAGDYARACPKFAESQRLDPSGGTLLHLAACHEQEGNTATAWAEFHEAISIARRDGRVDRENAAKARIAGLEKKLSRLTVTVPSTRPDGLYVRLDGRAMREAQFGVPFPVDPGKHEIVASAPDRKRWSTTIAVAAGAGQASVIVPALASEDVPTSIAPVVAHAPPPAPAPAPAAPAAAVKVDAADAAPKGSNSSKIVGFVLVGAGVVGLGVAGYFGLQYLKARDQRDEAAQAGDLAGRDSLHEDAKRTQLGAIVSAAVGGAVSGAGIVVILTSRDSGAKMGSTRLVPMVAPGASGAALVGSF